MIELVTLTDSSTPNISNDIEVPASFPTGPVQIIASGAGANLTLTLKNVASGWVLDPLVSALTYGSVHCSGDASISTDPNGTDLNIVSSYKYPMGESKALFGYVIHTQGTPTIAGCVKTANGTSASSSTSVLLRSLS